MRDDIAGWVKTLVELTGVDPHTIEPLYLTLTGRYGGPSANDPPDPIRLQAGFDHYIFGCGGYIQNPADNPENFVRVEWTMKYIEGGNRKDLQDAPTNFGDLLDTTGHGRRVIWAPAFKKVRGGNDLTIEFSASDTGDDTWEGDPKVIGVSLFGLKLAT